jgi:hypothetical protein
MRENQQMHQLLLNLLVMYGGSYMFRHDIAILRERSYSLLRDVLNWGPVDKILKICVLCLVVWCGVVCGDLVMGVLCLVA